MPSYEYLCAADPPAEPPCDWSGTIVGVPYAEADQQQCEKCEGPAKRVEIPSETQLNPAGGFKPGAILPSGQKVEGHFGLGQSYRKRRFRHDG